MVLFAWKKRAVNLRERIGQLKALERMKDVNRSKLSQESFIMVLLIALCLVLLVSPIINGYMEGVFANLMLTAVFALSLFLLRTTKKHILPWLVLIIGACVVFCIVFLNEVGELGSLDAYWLWFFIMPIMTMHFCGTWYGAFVCIPPIAIAVIFMWTPVRNMFLDYGANILENAVEAVLKLPKGEGKIEGEIIAQDGKFKMMITNDCDIEPYFDDDGLPYNEAENNISSPVNASSLHIGTWRVREIAVDYGGWAGYSYEKNRFTAKIVMHIKEETEK